MPVSSTTLYRDILRSYFDRNQFKGYVFISREIAWRAKHAGDKSRVSGDWPYDPVAKDEGIQPVESAKPRGIEIASDLFSLLKISAIMIGVSSNVCVSRLRGSSRDD